MKFLICNGSLTPNEESNTYTLCEMVKLGFEKLGHDCDIVTLRDLDYEGSTKDLPDELQPVIQKMFSIDGLIFATPIWWGGHSCYIQSVIERMDFIDSWSIDAGYKPFYGKVFGDIVSGTGDGFQHIHGNCYNFASMLGFTVPPTCNIESAAQGRDKILTDEETIGMVKSFVTNMTVWAKALQDAQVDKAGRHGVAFELPESITEGKRIPRKKGQKAKNKK
tara:strand:- start:380 stop:1042 length:663 start_codon:yes stop_codon:yes gene_type:complete